MNTKAVKPGNASAPTTGADIAKYVAAALLLAAGVFGFYWFGAWATPLRSLLVVAGLVAGFAVFTQTPAGRQTLEFVDESRFELRKVVWPSRQDSIRTTGVIIVVIVVFSLFLAAVDFLIGTGINKLLS
ncbi:MAG: preprotein translocase subunit SecE [Proteobacteria bacterium]|nr:preprotein translocase subunit SecE [Pseudomonadota bacterium]MBS0461780.1 preprotein translocase subunit SecE [Pseudomonadota bacterium]